MQIKLCARSTRTLYDDACLKESFFFNFYIGSCKFIQLAIFANTILLKIDIQSCTTVRYTRIR